jgi:SNF2 family DNA or RNA helicase
MSETWVELETPERITLLAHVEGGPSDESISWRLIIEPILDPRPESRRVSDARIERAVRRVLELDAGSLLDLKRGRRVVKAIPHANPAPVPPLDPNADADAYWSARQTVGQLVRPMLLSEPETPGLMEYQKAGVEWLVSHPAGILADDMGLGKTVQAIAAMRGLFASGDVQQAIILCPRSLLANWEAELTAWAPELSRMRLVPGAAQRDGAWSALRSRVHVLITNYEQMRQVPEPLRDGHVQLLIADEAHRLRNADALATRGLRRVNALRFWALTGTPIERDRSDLATLLSLLIPTQFAESDSRLPADLLRTRARAFILRRRKDDVLAELPDVVDSKETLELTEAQRDAYKAVVTQARGSSGTNLLALLNRCRLICDYDPETLESSKADRICELLDDIRLSGEKAVVFSYLLKPLEILQSRLGPAAVSLVGEMSNAQRESAISTFRTSSSLVALLASTKVAGEGLTLTEANHVIFFNEWWNPSSNAQARDRVVRIGQTRGVRVYRFRIRNTIEQSLDQILARKSKIFDDVIERLSVSGLEPDPEVLNLAENLRDDLG